MELKKKKKKVLIQATIQPELAEIIRKIADENSVSIAAVVSHALEVYTAAHKEI